MTSIENNRGKGGVKQIVTASENRKDLSAYRHKATARSGMRRRRTSGVETYRPTSEGGSGNKRYAVRPGMCVAMWGLSNNESTTDVCRVSSACCPYPAEIWGMRSWQRENGGSLSFRQGGEVTPREWRASYKRMWRSQKRI